MTTYYDNDEDEWDWEPDNDPTPFVEDIEDAHSDIRPMNIEDLRNLKKQLVSADIRPINGNFMAWVHPRYEARIYWLQRRRIKAIFWWMRVSRLLNLTFDQMMKDRPWKG